MATQDIVRRAPWVAALSAFPAAAWAAGGGTDSAQLATVVLLVLFIGGAYLLTHFVVDQLERRLLFSSGFEYILLGILLGPAVLHAFENLTPLAPVIALAAGWIGLLYGMELDLRRLVDSQDYAVRIALGDVIGTGAVMLVAARWFFGSGLAGEISDGDAWIASIALASAAAAGSSSAIDLLDRRYGETLRTGLLGYLRRAARIGDLVAIAAFGTIFCFFHEGGTRTATAPTPSDWILVTLGLGLALGILFSVFLGRDSSDNSRFVALVGIITLASGAAFFLQLSVLLVNLVLGIVLANASRSGAEIRDTLFGSSRPVALVLLVFAGALWRPVPVIPAVIASAGYIGLRILGTWLGCWLASLGTPVRRDLGRGLLAQGEVAVAMALSLVLVYDGPAVDIAYTAVLVSVVVNELVAPRLLKGLLVDAGEIRAEIPPAAATGG